MINNMILEICEILRTGEIWNDETGEKVGNIDEYKRQEMGKRMIRITMESTRVIPGIITGLLNKMDRIMEQAQEWEMYEYYGTAINLVKVFIGEEVTRINERNRIETRQQRKMKITPRQRKFKKRQRITELSKERTELLKKVYDKELEVEQEFKKEEQLESQIREIEDELMGIDTVYENDQGVIELLEGAKRVKKEKNF